MEFQTFPESQVPRVLKPGLQALLSQCFPDYLSQRTYYKQLPHLRLLGWDEGGVHVHCGLDHRMISVGGQPRSILGVVDLCVHPLLRGQGLGSEVLEEVQALAKGAQMDALLLFADQQNLYKKFGFEPVSQTTRWLALHEHQTLGVKSENTGDAMMVKSLHPGGWLEGEVDLMGYLF